MKSTIKKIIAVATALTVSVWLIGPGVAQAVTAQDLQDQIDALLATLDDLQDQLQAMTGEPPTVEGCLVTSFDRNLKQGMSGDDVNCLQIVLNSDSDTQLAASGVGSSGNETSYFGPLTKRGVIKFQEKYTEEILIPLNLTSGTGFVGYLTRVKLNTFLSPTFPAPPPTAPPADTTGPTVTILAPSKGATVSGAVNFQVSATDESGIQVVYFYIDDAEVSLDSTSPYQYSWNTTAYSNGSHKLSAKALDGANNFGSIADTNYTVNVDNAIPSEADTTGPTVTILSPSKGATVKDTVNFQVSATDDSGIQMVYFYIDDAEVFSDSTSPYQYSWNTTAYSNGSHKLSAKALDGADNLGSIADTNYTVNVDNATPSEADTTGPTVTILAPSKGATVNGSTNFQVSATDESGIQVVYFYIDDAEVSLDSTSPYQYSWNTTAYSNGSHKLSAKALDGADNQGTVADTNYTVNVDNAIPSEADTTGPTVTILSPSKGATVKDTVNFQVSATDDSGIQMVYFYIDDAEVFSDSTSPYQYNWDTTAYSNGSHKLSTKALDGADNLGSIADTNYTVNVDNPDPLTSAPPPDPVVTVPAGDVEEFTDPLVLWSFAPHRRYCRSTYDQAMRDCMNPQGRLPTDHWEIGQLSLEYWGMFSAYVMEVTYQGPGGTYFFGPQVTAGPVGQGGEDILYSRYPTPVYFPPSPTPKRFTFYLTGGKQTNIPSGAMRDVVARRQGVFDLTICFYKDIKPPDGLTPWQIWIPWDKVVSYWTWPDVIEYY